MSIETVGLDNDAFKEYCAKRLSVPKDFVRLFYEVLRMATFEGKDISHRQAFDLLNELYFRMAGKLRFKDYETFCFNKIRMDNKELRSQNGSQR